MSLWTALYCGCTSFSVCGIDSTCGFSLYYLEQLFIEFFCDTCSVPDVTVRVEASSRHCSVSYLTSVCAN